MTAVCGNTSPRVILDFSFVHMLVCVCVFACVNYFFCASEITFLVDYFISIPSLHTMMHSLHVQCTSALPSTITPD